MKGRTQLAVGVLVGGIAAGLYYESVAPRHNPVVQCKCSPSHRASPDCPRCPQAAAASVAAVEFGPSWPLFDVPTLGADCALPGGPDGYCVHGAPSIIAADRINEGTRRPPEIDMCSWWGDISGHRGWIPDKRRGPTEGLVPPRALCSLPRLCLQSRKEMCLGYRHSDVAGQGRIQYCPHHDGPFYLNHSVCPEAMGCVKEWPAACAGAAAPSSRSREVGKGRTFVFTKLNIARPANTWHWMTTMLEVFGAVVQTDPGLVDPVTLDFTPTSGRVVFLFMGNRGWNDGSSFDKVEKPFWLSMSKKGAENFKVLESFSACGAEYVDPAEPEPQCFPNAVVGTSTEVMMQWEDQPQSPKMVALATAFAKHIIRTLVDEAAGGAALPAAPSAVPAPWNRLYSAGDRPRMLIVKRGEPSGAANSDSTGKRELTNLHLLVAAAEKYGFAVDEYYPTDETTLAEQVRKVATADVLVGVHGAALGWAMLLSPHAVFIECRTTQDLTDRTFIYPNVAGVRDLTYIEWHQTEPRRDAPDQRLPFDINFVVTEESAQYHASVAMKKLIKKARWFAEDAVWH